MNEFQSEIRDSTLDQLEERVAKGNYEKYMKRIVAVNAIWIGFERVRRGEGWGATGASGHVVDLPGSRR
jgi:hypothetical protein